MNSAEMGRKLRKVRRAMDMLIDQRSSAAIDGLEGDNRVIHRGEQALDALLKKHANIKSNQRG